MTVWNVYDFRNNFYKRKNGPEYLLKKQELCQTINKECNQGVTTLLSKSPHLIYVYYKTDLFQMKVGQQRDLIKQIKLARKEYLSGVTTAGHAATAKN